TGEVLPVDGNFHTYLLREPLGVVAAIVPWNYATCLACWKLGPALATGCTVILKPSELTPLTGMKLGELAREVGFPSGVVNVLPGYGAPAGEALARHPGVDKIAFTGSIRPAAPVRPASADSNVKKPAAELGGKSPQIIFPDADLEKAVEACFWGIFGNKGEVCNAGSRVLVAGRAHDAFVEHLVRRGERPGGGGPPGPGKEEGGQGAGRALEGQLRAHDTRAPGGGGPAPRRAE